jgi:Cation transporting ATPase, C-terminus
MRLCFVRVSVNHAFLSRHVHCNDTLLNAFVFCQVFNEFNAREIGDVFDPIRSLGQSPMFIMVIFFTVMAQLLIIEYGGDFTQTYPLDYEELKFTILLGAGSIPVGFVMRLIPVAEDPGSFAGVERKTGKPKTKSLLTALVIALIPILGAIVYQLYFEIEEFIQPHEEVEAPIPLPSLE